MLVWKWFLYSRHKSQQLFIHNISLQQSTSILLLFAFSSSAQHKPEAGPFIPDAYFWLSLTHIPCMCMCARGAPLVPSPLEHLCRRVYDDVNFPVFVRNRTLFGSDSRGGGDVKCCRPDKLLEGVRRCRSCSNPAYYLDGACIMRRSRPKCHRKPKRKCKRTVSKALSVLLSNNW
jgi:hypothetical protein